MTSAFALLLLAACTGNGTTDSAEPLPEGCVPPPETALAEVCACEDAVVEVGSGATAYETLAEGSPLTMVHGPQGGWHMLGSARFGNLLPIVSIHYTISVAESGAVVSDNLYRVQMVNDSECTGFYPGMYGYLDVAALAEGDRDTPPELLADTPLVLTMEVTDDEGRVATDTLGVIAALDAEDLPDTGGDSGGE